MGKTECDIVLRGYQESPKKLRLKAELLAWPSCVQNQQQKPHSYQEGTEALSQKCFQNEELGSTDRATTGSAQWGSVMASEAWEHGRENVRVLEIKITRSKDAPHTPFDAMSKGFEQSSHWRQN